MKSVTVGVLALQGDVSEHREALEGAGAEVEEVRTVPELSRVDALILPGGESSTLGLLLADLGLDVEIARRAKEGMPVYGTCMGLILMAREITLGGTRDQKLLGLLDLKVARNAYGRQRESFEAEFPIPAVGAQKFPGVFIRAPRIEQVGPDVEVLASFEETPVLVRQRHLLGSAFHPELSGDLRLHKYFLQMVKEAKGSRVKVHG